MSIEERVTKLEEQVSNHEERLLITEGDLSKLTPFASPELLNKINHIGKNVKSLDSLIEISPSLIKTVDEMRKYGMMDEIGSEPITPEQVIKNQSINKQGKTTEQTSQSKPKNVNIWFQTFYQQKIHEYECPTDNITKSNTLGIMIKYKYPELHSQIDESLGVIKTITDKGSRMKKKSTHYWKTISALDKVKSTTVAGKQAIELMAYVKKHHKIYKDNF